MLCVTQDANGVLSLIQPQPSDVTTCAMVIASAQEVGLSPFNLSQADAEAIGAAIAIVWGAGFAARAVIRALGSGESQNEVDSI